MTAILLVEDDKDAWPIVRLALEPAVIVHIADSLASALDFLRTRSHQVSGVIVDLNLTNGPDNFGRQVLERLREMAMPCVIFSGHIKSPEDAQLYQNQYGVLTTIHKEGGLTQLRESVNKMISVSVEQLREHVLVGVKQEMERRNDHIEHERCRSEDLIEEMQQIAGKTSAAKLASSEAVRIEKLIADAKSLRDTVECEIHAAKTREDLDRLLSAFRQTLAVL